MKYRIDVEAFGDVAVIAVSYQANIWAYDDPIWVGYKKTTMPWSEFEKMLEAIHDRP